MENIEQIERFRGFFQRYRKFTEDRSEIRFQFFKTRFEQLKVGYESTARAVLDVEAYRSSKFNIFNLLGVAHLEVSTHSAVIADLLNPAGTHGQRHLFLIQFIELLNDISGEENGTPFPVIKAEDVEQSIWFIDKEKTMASGRIDIVVSSPDASFLLVIENKIGAGEQPEQLDRYAKWMGSQNDHYDKQALIYLTPAGEKATTNSGHEYFRISYRKNIRNWLEKTLGYIRSERVRRSIEQYIEVVQNL